MPAKIRKFYAETERGAVHIQESGMGAKVLLFVNVTSWGTVLMDEALPLFAEKGYRALNLDIMGYGRSDKRDPADGDWMIEDFATNIEQAMESAGVRPLGIVAGHMAGLIGVELARRAPEGLRGLSIEGMPIIDPAVRATNRTAPTPTPYPWTEDGAHAVEYWNRIYKLVKRLDPAFELTANPGTKFRRAFITYLEVGCFEPGTMPAVAHYEIEQKLAEITLPTMVMCSDYDWNLPSHPKILSHLKHGREFRWTGVHPLHDMTVAGRAPEYVEAIDGFFAPLLE
jgi:pimeloyl-ACP methyl ester carboxylesterase